MVATSALQGTGATGALEHIWLLRAPPGVPLRGVPRMEAWEKRLGRVVELSGSGTGQFNVPHNVVLVWCSGAGPRFI